MIGRNISHYRIEEELGRGGMGVVYRARDERLQRSVALKLLPEQIAGQAERRARILAEARAAAALNHPGITTIYEVGEDGDQLFIAMELVAGKTLRAMLSEGALEPRALARLGAQVAEALAAAHAQGVVHGDVKPENIIVQADGRVKLLDFGIARQVAAETLTLTRAAPAASWLPDSQIAGTLAYMAPEQLRAEPTDARADLFSLGVVLYELAAGRRPFAGPTATALIAQILNEPPTPLGSAGPIVPGELARIIHKLLEKNPNSRYQSARELQVDLNNLARDLELGAVLPAAVAGKRAVAVLPFKLLTPNPEDDYLSVALADAVINELGAGGALLIRPTSTVLRYAKQPIDPLLAARELNVQVIVDGSIQKFGPKLRVHVQALNAADGMTLLSSKYDSEMAALFGLQDQMAEALSRALGVRAAPATAEPPTKNPKAYELYLRGAERLSRLNRWDIRTAIELLEDATKLDPRFADAWGRLAEAYLQMGLHFEPGPQWFRRAERVVRRALSLDPQNANAHCARGRILWSAPKRYQNRPALRAHAAALRFNPSCLEALRNRAVIFYHVGLFEEARENLRAGLVIHPEDPLLLLSTGHLHLFLRDYARAEDYYARVLRVDPANLIANLTAPVIPLYQQRLDRAEEQIRAARHVVADPMLTSVEALLWAQRGEKRKAEKAVREALRTGKSLLHAHHTLHYAAAACAVLGQPAQAVQLLRKASATGLPNYPLYRDDPHLASLRNHPPFLRLFADLKRDWEKYRREFAMPSGRYGTASKLSAPPFDMPSPAP